MKIGLTPLATVNIGPVCLVQLFRRSMYKEESQSALVKPLLAQANAFRTYKSVSCTK